MFVSDPTKAIDQLVPRSVNHGRVLSYIVNRLEDSERAMSKFYPRWQVSEKKIQAYIDLPDWERTLKQMNDSGKPPAITSLTIPYSFATISTIVTFLVTAFTARQQIFSIGAKKAEAVKPARNMETVHQYNAEHTRMVKHLFQFFRDGETYGMCVFRLAWKDEKKIRTRRIKVVGVDGQETWESKREMATVFQGNEAVSWDPFMFFPDPRVPMTDVNKKGEYVFWRSYSGMHILLKEEAAGNFKWVKFAGSQIPRSKFSGGDSSRNIRADGEANPGATQRSGSSQGRNYLQVDQGTIDLIPKELGLGPQETPQKWLFTILNKAQIVQAQPIEDDHGMHPVAVAEPYSLGYGFGNLGMADYLGPLQDTISWFINSHFDNVRRTINDVFVVDPSMVEMQDVKRPGPGKAIRLKKQAYGRKVGDAIQQLPIQDVTQGHVKDAELMMLIGQRLSAATDILQGQGKKGGRDTATQVRAESGSAIARLQSQAKLYSAQAMVDLAEMSTLNVQQYMDREFFMEVVGSNGMPEGIAISPEMLVGDFHYPIHDGTMPLDKVAMLEVWRQLLVAIQTDPVLRSTYDLPAMFGFVAELGGIVNLDSFKINMAPPGEVEREFQQGNLIAAALGGSNGSGSGSQLLGGSGPGQAAASLSGGA